MREGGREGRRDGRKEGGREGRKEGGREGRKERGREDVQGKKPVMLMFEGQVMQLSKACPKGTLGTALPDVARHTPVLRQ
jgi:hypothetical protein